MPNVVHLEIRADVPHRAAKFYSTVFGWNVKKKQGQADHFLLGESSTSTGGVRTTVTRRINRDAVVPRYEVGSIEGAIKKIYQSGGKVVAQKKEIPGVGFFTYCHDTEGNTFSILERKKGK